MGRIYPEIEILAEAIRHHELQLSVATPKSTNLLTGPLGPLSNALPPKIFQKAIKTSAVYEFMT